MTEFEFVYKELSRLSKNITLIKREVKDINKNLKKVSNANEVLMNQYDTKFFIDGEECKMTLAIVKLMKKVEELELGVKRIK